MKRTICFALIIASLLTLCACGSASETATSSSAGTITTVENKEPVKSEPVAEETNDYAGETIVDNEYCVFKVTGVDPKGTWGYTVKAYCENKTDKTLMFSWQNVSVNGMMEDPFWATEVAAGKKSNTEIAFTGADFTTADEIVFTLRIYDSDDWMASPVVEQEYSIYPTGKTADTVTYAERDTSNSLTVVDNENIKFVIEGTDPKNMWGYAVNLYIENKTDKQLMYAWDNVSVNGFMVDPFWATEVAPGKKSTTQLSFFTSDLEENGIKDVEEIEFTLRVSDYDDWMASPIFEGTFTYNPK